jgi:hypothetical protein
MPRLHGHGLPLPQQNVSPQWQSSVAAQFVQLTMLPQLFVVSMPQPLTPAHVVETGSSTQLGTQLPP